MKSKFFIFCIAAFAMALAIPFASADDVMKVEVDKFKIQVPLTWMIQYTKTPYVFVIYSAIEENDTFQENANLIVEQLPQKMSVANYKKASLEAIKQSYADLKVVESKDNYQIFKGLIKKVEVEQIQFYYINNKEAYILTFSSDPDNFKRYLDDFRKIAASFKFQ